MSSRDSADPPAEPHRAESTSQTDEPTTMDVAETHADGSDLVTPAESSSPSPLPSRIRRTRPSTPIMEEREAEELHEQQHQQEEQQRRRRRDRRRVRSPTPLKDDDPPVPDEGRTEPSEVPRADSADQGRKRVRREDPDAKKRGARLFGMLNSTLTKFKTDAETQKTGDAARRRALLEARLQEKLKRESEEISLKHQLETELRGYLNEARQLAETIASREAEHRTQRALKRRMASFLWTTRMVESDLGHYRDRTQGRSGGGGGEGGRGRGRSSGRGGGRDRGPSRRSDPIRGPGDAPRRIAAHIPSTLPPISRTANEQGDYPLYYLPYKLLPSQDDVLDEQEAKVDDEIDAADEEWDKERDRLEEKLGQIKAKIKHRREEARSASKPAAADAADAAEGQNGGDRSNTVEAEDATMEEDNADKTREDSTAADQGADSLEVSAAS